jgi:hypothetical protein
MLQGSRFIQVFDGVWRTAATIETEELRVRAALKILPDDAALSHASNLRWRGLDVHESTPLHFSTASRLHVQRRGLVVHRRQAALRSTFVRGVPLLSAERTFVDAATQLDERTLLRSGDWLVRNGHVDLLDLKAFVLESHLDGVQQARRIAPLVSEHVDSVRESDVRWIILEAGLPIPIPNLPIFDAHGVWIAKGDLAYPLFKVLVEHDGWHHERDAAQRQRDHLRRERLEAEGWLVIIITVADFRNKTSIAWRVYNALKLRGYTGPRPYFGGRSTESAPGVTQNG